VARTGYPHKNIDPVAVAGDPLFKIMRTDSRCKAFLRKIDLLE